MTVYEGAASLGDFATADAATGAWSVDLTGLADGAHAFTAEATDAAGNTSPVSAPATVTVGGCTSGGGAGDVTPGTPVIPTGPAPQPMGGAASTGGAETPGFELGDVPSVAPGCQLKPFRAYVRRRGVRKVVFRVDGKRVAVSRRADAKGQFVALIKTAKLGPGRHVLTGTVVYKAKGRKARTLKLRFRKCDQCQSRRVLRVHPRGLHKGERTLSATVYLNGKRYKTVKGGSARIVLKGMSKGIQRVRIVARTNRGRTVVDKRRFRTCMKKR